MWSDRYEKEDCFWCEEKRRDMWVFIELSRWLGLAILLCYPYKDIIVNLLFTNSTPQLLYIPSFYAHTCFYYYFTP